MIRIKVNSIKTLCYGISIFVFALQQTYVPSINEYTQFTFKILKIVPLIITFILELAFGLKYTAKSLLMITLFGCLIIINTTFNGASSDLFYILFFMLICRKTDSVLVLKAYSIAVFFALFLTYFCCFSGIIPDIIIRGHRGMGFLYSSFGPNLFLHACVAYIAYKQNKIQRIIVLLIAVVNAYLFSISETLSAFVFVMLLLLLHLLIQNKRFLVLFSKKIIRNIVIASPFWVCAMMLLLQILYNKHYYEPFFVAANALVSQRLRMGREAFIRYSVNLFGQPILWNTGISTSSVSEYFYVDSSFLQILLQYGVIMLILICSFMSIYFSLEIRKKNYQACIAALVFIMHCAFDPQLLSFRYNPFLICSIYAMNCIRKNNYLSFNNQSIINKERNEHYE